MKKTDKMTLAASALSKLTDNELMAIQLAMPWQVDISGDESVVDADGFGSGTRNAVTRDYLQRLCWDKFNESPHINTAVRGHVGRLAGFGFEITSDIQEIQEAITETEFDPRNRLYDSWPKFVGRSVLEGELHLLLTVHQKGFVEVDFIDPSNIAGGGEDGVIYHPNKSTMPLFYFVTPSPEENKSVTKKTMLIPSVFMAYYPELLKVVKKGGVYKEELTKEARSSNNAFNSLGGFQRFIVSWDKSLLTRRNTSHLRTVIQWLNLYENLKKYEIDHKKSAGSYLWVVTIEDAKSFRTWLALSDEERRKTGIMAKKTPGATLVMPPGMAIEAKNPSLPTISDQDTDILHMVTGGLNEPEDVSTGQSKGTFASVKASRGPMSDRISDEMAYFERFLKFDFYRSVFFLKSKVSDFPETFSVKTAIDFDDKQEPIFKDIENKPEFLIDVSFPVSEVNDAETSARAFLGVKHGSVNDVLGVPNAIIAKKMGLGNYRRMRLQDCTEKEKFPKLEPPVDAGGEQLEPNNAEQKEVKKKIIKRKK
jgi:hypothetical protein